MLCILCMYVAACEGGSLTLIFFVCLHTLSQTQLRETEGPNPFRELADLHMVCIES